MNGNCLFCIDSDSTGSRLSQLRAWLSKNRLLQWICKRPIRSAVAADDLAPLIGHARTFSNTTNSRFFGRNLLLRSAAECLWPIQFDAAKHQFVFAHARQWANFWSPKKEDKCHVRAVFGHLKLANRFTEKKRDSFSIHSNAADLFEFSAEYH